MLGVTNRDGMDLYGSGRPPRPRFEYERPFVAVVPRPGLVDISFRLWLAAACAGFVAALLSLGNLDAVAAAVRAMVEGSQAEASPQTRDRVVAIVTEMLVAGGALSALAQAGLAVGMRSGRAGTRLALVLLAGLSVANLLVSREVLSLPAWVALLFCATLSVAASVIMVLPASSQWFSVVHR